MSYRLRLLAAWLVFSLVFTICAFAQVTLPLTFNPNDVNNNFPVLDPIMNLCAAK